MLIAHPKPTAPLVLLHGFMGDANDWEPFIRHLSGTSCVALTLPGHGHNQDAIPRLHEFNDWIATQIQKLGLQHYHLLGYSLGGRLALQYAASQPAGLMSLIIENAHPGLTERSQQIQRQQQDAIWARRFYREPLNHVLQDWYRQPVFQDLDEQARARVIADRSQQQGPALARMLAACSLARQPDWRSWIKTTRLPFLYLCGQDDLKFQKIGRELQTLNPALTLEFIPGGHNLHRAQPALMAEKLRTWFQSSTL